MRYDLKAIMKRAWEIYRGIAEMTFSEALKLSWAEAKGEYKEMNIKDWFASKKYKQKGSNRYETRIFSIIKETEKAMFVFVGSDFAGNIFTWVPKSQVEVTKTDNANFAVRRISDAKESVREYNQMMSFYR